MGEESRYGARDIKKVVWTGPRTDTYGGNRIFGVVGRTDGNSLKAGYCTIATGLFVEQGGSDREHHRWEPKHHQELGHAIFAAQKIVKREVDFSYEPDRHQPEEKYASPAMPVKPVRAKDSPQSRFDALLSKLRMPGPRKEVPEPVKRGRSIDR